MTHSNSGHVFLKKKNKQTKKNNAVNSRVNNAISRACWTGWAKEKVVSWCHGGLRGVTDEEGSLLQDT